MKHPRRSASWSICILVCLAASFPASAVADMDPDAPTVLITGTNRGIGLEFARQYAALGWNVIGDLGLQVVPQGWMTQMWEPTGWLIPALIYLGSGPVFALLGYPFFNRRDL